MEKLSLVPQKPGVYLMKDSGDKTIYIGKAKNLKVRLSSYFAGSHDAKVTAMLTQIKDFDYFITKTENDALALEANLINKHKPHYNILLKDDKRFPYIKIVDAEFPYLEVTRKITRGGKYFGPYFNGIWARELVDTLKDVFPLRSCTRIPKSACVNHQIGRCLAPCVDKITSEEYLLMVDKVKMFLRGENDFGAREILTEKMNKAASLEQFEVAIRYRNGLSFLDKLGERTITQVGRNVNCDVFAYATRGEIIVFSVLAVRAGAMIGIQNFTVENKIESESDALGSFIMQYYQTNVVPEQIVASVELSEVSVFTPKIALKKKLLDMANANAQEYLNTSIEKIQFKQEFTIGACKELGKILGLSHVPRKIECYDISHFGGENIVASMVVFLDGAAERKLYRRFKIQHKMGNNDYLSLNEVLRRRFARLDSADPSFGSRPDLIIIDGGKGQLSSVLETIPNNIPVIAIAKENEEIFTTHSNQPIILDKRSYALRLVQRIRDEAHRFSITYQKKLR